MTSVYTILLFLLLIGIAIYQTKESFSAGYAQGREKTLEKVERQEIYSIDSRINPIVISSKIKIPELEAKILSNDKKNTAKDLLVEQYANTLANNLMGSLLKNKLLYIETYSEDGDVVLECILVIAENKNNFYEKISKSTNSEIIDPN
jgi:hypothetical protein